MASCDDHPTTHLQGCTYSHSQIAWRLILPLVVSFVGVELMGISHHFPIEHYLFTSIYFVALIALVWKKSRYVILVDRKAIEVRFASITVRRITLTSLVSCTPLKERRLLTWTHWTDIVSRELIPVPLSDEPNAVELSLRSGGSKRIFTNDAQRLADFVNENVRAKDEAG